MSDTKYGGHTLQELETRYNAAESGPPDLDNIHAFHEAICEAFPGLLRRIRETDELDKQLDEQLDTWIKRAGDLQTELGKAEHERDDFARLCVEKAVEGQRLQCSDFCESKHESSPVDILAAVRAELAQEKEPT